MGRTLVDVEEQIRVLLTRHRASFDALPSSIHDACRARWITNVAHTLLRSGVPLCLVEIVAAEKAGLYQEQVQSGVSGGPSAFSTDRSFDREWDICSAYAELIDLVYDVFEHEIGVSRPTDYPAQWAFGADRKTGVRLKIDPSVKQLDPRTPFFGPEWKLIAENQAVKPRLEWSFGDCFGDHARTNLLVVAGPRWVLDHSLALADGVTERVVSADELRPYLSSFARLGSYLRTRSNRSEFEAACQRRDADYIDLRAVLTDYEELCGS